MVERFGCCVRCEIERKSKARRIALFRRAMDAALPLYGVPLVI
jgi:hypothetical protein